MLDFQSNYLLIIIFEQARANEAPIYIQLSCKVQRELQNLADLIAAGQR
jgi:hypothetical protein